MVILGTFFPWNASTLVACGLSPVVPSGGGIFRCKFSCWRSFVVMIFVKRPATISMTSVTGIPLISYCCPVSILPRKECLDGWRDRERTSSLAKLCMWPRSRTLMRLGELAVEPFRDNMDRCVGSRRGEGGGIASE